MGARSRERRSTRGARRRLLLAIPCGLALLLVPGTASSADPTIEAVGSAYGFAWSPSSAQTTPGGAVTFRSSSASVPHGVTWSGGPATPSCSGVPINDGKTSWSGSCSFPQAGTYSFYCTVHPTEMKGTVTASTGGGGGGTTDPGYPPPPGEGGGSQSDGPLLRGLRLAKSQQGRIVRGSVAVTEAASGGKLDVELLIAGDRVGRQVRGGIGAGRARFAVALRRPARETLEERGQLTLSVRIRMTAPGGKLLVVNRSVTLHG